MKKKLVIVGTGEIARVAYEYFTEDSDYTVISFAEDKEFIKKHECKGLEIVDIEHLNKKFDVSSCEIFVALGNGKLNYSRTNVYDRIKKMGFVCASYVSSNAFRWKNVQIGENCFILEQNILQTFSSVGNNVFMWSGNHLGHSSHIQDNCFITSHVVISGMCSIGKNTFIGVNSSVAESITIADDNYIAMGSVINKNTEANSIYKGNPAARSPLSAKTFCGVEQ